MTDLYCALDKAVERSRRGIAMAGLRRFHAEKSHTTVLLRRLEPSLIIREGVNALLFFLKSHQDGTVGDLVAFREGKGLYHTGGGGLDRVFHFHGLQDHQ